MEFKRDLVEKLYYLKEEFGELKYKLNKIGNDVDNKIKASTRNFINDSLTFFRHAHKVAPGFFERIREKGSEFQLPSDSSNNHFFQHDACPVRPVLPFEKDLDVWIARRDTHQTFPKRADLNKEQWEWLDSFNFKKLKTHLENLCDCCNFYEDNIKNKNPDIAECKISEVISKGLSYLNEEMIDGQTLKIPTKNNQGNFELVDYKISKKIIGSNLPIFVLEPPKDSKHPLRMVIRGTDPYFNEKKTGREGAKESLYADTLNARGVGAKVIQKEELCQFEEYQLTGAIISGHSLGGTLAAILAVKLSGRNQHLSSPLKVHGFNATAVDKKTADRFNNMKKNKPEIVNFVAEGDIVSSAGKKWIGDVYGVEVSGSKGKNPFVKHTLHMLERSNKFFKVDTAKENKKLARRVTEGLRSGVGKVISLVLLVTDSLPIWKK
jgi:Lipase (class 3)